MEQLRNWRKASGLSTEEAGHLIGVSNVQWSRIEAGSRKVAPEKVLELERITGISRHEIRPDVFGPAVNGEAA
ncbi:helix-turn-helix transcriptional regulator [Mesorhizobium sp. M0520]|uniref:helix-turn-helix domain-containing protein n=1 Tax=unclassified Mesorhizobium TaxID=325217 RepID=UPI00333A8EAE